MIDQHTTIAVIKWDDTSAITRCWIVYQGGPARCSVAITSASWPSPTILDRSLLVLFLQLTG
jgi:hypothetical protein